MSAKKILFLVAGGRAPEYLRLDRRLIDIVRAFRPTGRSGTAIS
jgi:putative intracellular protease/amidase